MNGVKFDAGKVRFSLLPWRALVEVVKVLEFGTARYEVGNWRRVPDAQRRYFDAAQRHLLAWWAGEKEDPETTLSHLAHASCCVLFLLALDVAPAPERGDALSERDDDAPCPLTFFERIPVGFPQRPRCALFVGHPGACVPHPVAEASR